MSTLLEPYCSRIACSLGRLIPPGLIGPASPVSERHHAIGDGRLEGGALVLRRERQHGLEVRRVLGQLADLDAGGGIRDEDHALPGALLVARVGVDLDEAQDRIDRRLVLDPGDVVVAEGLGVAGFEVRRELVQRGPLALLRHRHRRPHVPHHRAQLRRVEPRRHPFRPGPPHAFDERSVLALQRRVERIALRELLDLGERDAAAVEVVRRGGEQVHSLRDGAPRGERIDRGIEQRAVERLELRGEPAAATAVAAARSSSAVKGGGSLSPFIWSWMP
jgi:hypothetical protein